MNQQDRVQVKAERMHRTVGDMSRTHFDDVPANDMRDANMLVDSALASASYGLRASVHSTMGVSSGAYIFGRDVQLNIPVVADQEMIRRRRQARIEYNAGRENAKRLRKDYSVGDEVLILIENPRKMDAS